MRNTVINSYIAILAITVLGSIASLAIVKVATDVAYVDDFTTMEYTPPN